MSRLLAKQLTGLLWIRQEKRAAAVSVDYTSSRMTITETRFIIFIQVTNLRKEKLRGLLR